MNSFHRLTMYLNLLKITAGQTRLLKNKEISSTLKTVMSFPGSLGRFGTFSASDWQLMCSRGSVESVSTHGAGRNRTLFQWLNLFLGGWWIIFVRIHFHCLTLALISYPFQRRRTTLITRYLSPRKIQTSPFPLLTWLAICSGIQMLGDRRRFRERMSLKFYLDSQNFLLHFSDTRWDNYHGLLGNNPPLLR